MADLDRSLTASDIMVAEPICATPNLSLRKLKRLLDEHEISGAPVVDRSGVVVGMVTLRDVVEAFFGPHSTLPAQSFIDAALDHNGVHESVADRVVTVEEVMKPVVTVRAADDLRRIAATMTARRSQRVVVVDDDHLPIGLISNLRLIAALCAETAR